MGMVLPSTLAHLTDVRAITYQENKACQNHVVVFETLHHGGNPAAP